MSNMDVLNNKIILLRKSLKSIINQTKLNLIKKIKKDKEKSRNVDRKESELLCFRNNQIKCSEVPLSLGLYPEKLLKILTSKDSIEIDRVYARILSSPIIQKTLRDLKNQFGVESVEKFLKSNEKNIKKSSAKRLLTINDTKNDSSSKPVSDKKKSKSADPPSENVKKSAKSKEQHKKEAAPPKENKTADPFFIDSSGSNYLAAVTTAQSSSDSDDEPDKEPRKKVAKIQRKSQPKLAPIKKFKEQTQEDKLPTNDKTEDLHPSWKAKQQMKKVQIQEFQGTKIKFDDD